MRAVVYADNGYVGKYPGMGGGPVPVNEYVSLDDDADGKYVVNGGGPVPLSVYHDVKLDAMAGDGVVVSSGNIPFKGGGPVPFIVYVTVTDATVGGGVEESGK